jgi:hypothetical protein
VSRPGPLARAAIAALAACSVGCGPIIERPRLLARPDGTLPGDPLGSFDGQVVDADTEKPIQGAIVLASWSFARGLGLVGPSGATTRTVETDVDGRYTIPRLSDLPGGLSTRVAGFTLVVYKRGYVGYRSDRFFRDGAARSDFAQHANMVRLEAFSEELSHVRHLAFVAGPAELRKASAWELELASLELEQGGPRPPGRGRVTEELPLTAAAPLDVWPLLRLEDLRAAISYGGEFEETRLTDLPRTNFYDSHHFKATGQPERFDVALRVWRLPAPRTSAQYDKLAKTLPGAKPTDEIGTRSLRAGERDILALVWQDDPHGVVAQLTCGRGTCPDYGALIKLAQTVQGRLDMLGGPAAPEPKKKLEEEMGPRPGQPATPSPAEPVPPPGASPAQPIPAPQQKPPKQQGPMRLTPPEMPR